MLSRNILQYQHYQNKLHSCSFDRMLPVRPRSLSALKAKAPAVLGNLYKPEMFTLSRYFMNGNRKGKEISKNKQTKTPVLLHRRTLIKSKVLVGSRAIAKSLLMEPCRSYCFSASSQNHLHGKALIFLLTTFFLWETSMKAF